MHRVCLRGAGVLVGGDFLRTALCLDTRPWLAPGPSKTKRKLSG